jgi:hypothetical protein
MARDIRGELGAVEGDRHWTDARGASHTNMMTAMVAA